METAENAPKELPDRLSGAKEGRSVGVFRPKKANVFPTLRFARRIGRSEQTPSETQKVVKEGLSVGRGRTTYMRRLSDISSDACY